MSKGILIFILLLGVGGVIFVISQTTLSLKENKKNLNQIKETTNSSAQLSAQKLIDQIETNYMLSIVKGDNSPIMSGNVTDLNIKGNIESGKYVIKLDNKNNAIIELIDVVIGNSKCNGNNVEGIICK